MKSKHAVRWPYGMTLVILAAAAGTGLSINNYLATQGISHTAGAAGMIGTCAIMTLVAICIARAGFGPRWFRAIVLLLMLLDALVTGIAGWFLETQLLMAFMGLVLLGLFLHVVAGPRRPPRRPIEAQAGMPA